MAKAAGCDIADVELQISVDLAETFAAVDQGEEPARPGEVIRIAAFIEFAIEYSDQGFHRPFGLGAFSQHPTALGPRLSPYLALELIFRDSGKVDFTTAV